MNVQSSAFCVSRSTRTKLSIDFCVELWYDPAARDIVSAESSPVMSQLTRDESRQGHAGAPSPTSSLHDVRLDTATYRLNQLIRYDTVRARTYVEWQHCGRGYPEVVGIASRKAHDVAPYSNSGRDQATIRDSVRGRISDIRLVTGTLTAMLANSAYCCSDHS